MKREIDLRVLLALAFFASYLPAGAFDITNTSGKVFQNVKIQEVRPDGIKVFHSKGLELLRFTELPESIQKQYNYDPEKEKAFIKDLAAQQAEQAATRAEADLLNSIRNTGKTATLRIIQIAQGGALATGYYSEQEEYENTEYRTVTKEVGLGGSQIDNTVTKRVPMKTEKRTRTNRYPLPDRIFVIGVPSHLVDDDTYTCKIYPCGRHQYTTVMGGQATVERYATSPTVARKLMFRE